MTGRERVCQRISKNPDSDIGTWFFHFPTYSCRLFSNVSFTEWAKGEYPGCHDRFAAFLFEKKTC